MLAATVLFCAAAFGQTDACGSRSEFAKQVRAAYEELDSLYFEAKVTGYEWASMKSARARGRVREFFKVWMADGPRFRVEGLKGGDLVCAVVCDGKEVTDWYPAENSYTRYEMPAFDEEFSLDCRLFGNRELREFCTSWVDERGPYGKRLEEILSLRETRRAKPRLVDDVGCDVFVSKADRDISGGFFPNVVSDTYTVYFDPDTHLLAKDKRSLIMLSLVAGYYRLTTTYRNVQPNIELPPDIFVFKPPEGAKFIPPDDPRFRPKELVQLTGKPAPAFTLPVVELGRANKGQGDEAAEGGDQEMGQTKGQDKAPMVSLADFNGKKAVLVVFWATWCAPCQKEIPSLIKLHKEFEGDLAIIGVCGGDKSVKDVEAFLKKRPLPYPVLYDEEQEATQAYGAKGLPYTILIDKTGTVVRVWQGWSGEEEEKEIREELAKVLSDQPASAPAAEQTK